MRPRQVARFAAALAVVAVLYAVLFLKQDAFIQLLGGEAHKARPWIAPARDRGFSRPSSRGSTAPVAGFFLKLFKFD